LSEARANTVVAWLTGKGIAAGRLTARGYGMKVPVADNGSDEGRAKNRRVELKKQGCGK
jgi:outer membrane protein OmpA-like peptidoglycan-associated protein